MTATPHFADLVADIVEAEPQRDWVVPRTIGIAGKIGHGKSTLALMLHIKFRHMELAFADHLRDVCEILLGIYREHLSDAVLKATPLVGFDNGHVFPFDPADPVALNLQIDKALGVAYMVPPDVFTNSAVTVVERKRVLVGANNALPSFVRRSVQMRFLQHIWMPLRNGRVFSPREIMQLVGTEIFRAVDPPIWTWAWNQKAQDHDVVAPDMRFPNEMEIINARGGVCIHVSRPGQEPTSGHVSETSLDDVEFDYVVVNDGDLEHLWDTLVGILDTYANECGDDVDTEYAKLLTA